MARDRDRGRTRETEFGPDRRNGGNPALQK
jgi:hypothetical protein